MKVHDVLACSFSRWYAILRKVTFKSVRVPLPKEFIDYLLADNVVLPSHLPGLKNRAGALEDDGDNDSDDDDGWDDASDQQLEAPQFDELDRLISEVISQLGGQAFVKLNWSCPKDAAWISLNGSLKCNSPTDVYLLLKSSDFIMHDLTQPFKNCEDEETNTPTVEYELIIRKWVDINPGNEFRCFVHNKRLIGICQRDDSQFYDHISQQKDDIVRDVTSFFKEQIVTKFPLDDYVFDVVRQWKDRVSLVDLNPYGPTTDSLLFDWAEEPLLDPADPAGQSPATNQIPEFRYVQENTGIRANPFRRYGVPEDILHLTSGQDPLKMIDLLQLQERRQQQTSDDSD